MAVAHDTQTRFPATENTSDTTTGDRTFTHTPVGTPAGVVVAVCGAGTSAVVTGVLYGGTAMTSQAFATDTVEAGRVEIFTLAGQAIATGAQTVTLQGCTASAKFATCSTVTSATNQTTVDVSGLKNTTSSTNPFISLTLTQSAMMYGAMHWGGTTWPTTPLTGQTDQNHIDYGALSALTTRSTNAETAGSHSLGWTTTTEDHCLVATALAEASSGTAVGQALETDTALSITPIKEINPVVETDTAQTMTVVKAPLTVAVNQALETDAVQVVTPVNTPITVAVGQAAETDTAQPVTTPQGLGQAVETDTALTVTPVKTIIKAVGQAAETDTAQPVAAVNTPTTVAVGQAAETDESLRLSVPFVIPVGQVAETDTAQPVTPLAAPIIRAVGQAAETDIAQQIYPPAKVNQVGEIDAALPISPIKPILKPFGQVTDTHTALTVVPQSTPTILTLGLATETDLAQIIIFQPPYIPARVAVDSTNTTTGHTDHTTTTTGQDYTAGYRGLDQ